MQIQNVSFNGKLTLRKNIPNLNHNAKEVALLRKRVQATPYDIIAERSTEHPDFVKILLDNKQTKEHLGVLVPHNDDDILAAISRLYKSAKNTLSKMNNK